MFSNRLIGLFYILLSIFGSLIGFSLSVIMRVEINNPFKVLGEEFYYISITSHAVVMVFYFLTTISTGFIYCLIPSMCSVRTMYSNSLSFLSILLHLLSLIILFISLLSGQGVSTGWTLYVPLSLKSYNESLSLDLAILSLIIFSFSSIINSINIVLTIIKSFYLFNSLLDVSIFVWSSLLTSILVIFSTPSLICVLIMLLSDRNLNTFYFDCEFGGNPLLFQSIFWIWGHPEVYILILPIFGIVSEVICIICNGYIYNKNGIIFSMLSLTILSFLVWGHHMFTVGWDLDIKGFFMISTVVISIPTGVKVFSWVYSLFLYGVRLNIISLLLNLFILTFTLGGVTGVFLSNYSLDILYHDSYFVVGHFHTILASSSLFGLLSGFILFNKLLLNIKECYFNYFLFIISIITMSLIQLLFSFHIKGILGVSRRISNYMLEYYFLFHLGSISVVGLWVSIVLVVLFILFFINYKDGFVVKIYKL